MKNQNNYNEIQNNEPMQENTGNFVIQENETKKPKFKVEEVVKKANNYIMNPKEYGDIVPTAEGLAVVLGMSRPE